MATHYCMQTDPDDLNDPKWLKLQVVGGRPPVAHWLQSQWRLHLMLTMNLIQQTKKKQLSGSTYYLLIISLSKKTLCSSYLLQGMYQLHSIHPVIVFVCKVDIIGPTSTICQNLWLSWLWVTRQTADSHRWGFSSFPSVFLSPPIYTPIKIM